MKKITGSYCFLSDKKKLCGMFLFVVFAFIPYLFCSVSTTTVPAPISSSSTLWDLIMKEQSELNILRGTGYMAKGNYSKASIEFLKAISSHPSSMAYALYGASLYWMGDNEQSILNYDKAIELDPSNDVAWQLKGISFARDLKLKEALEFFKKAFELNPSRSDVLMNIGSVYFSLNDIQRAIEYIKEAIKIDPRNPLYYYQLGIVYFSVDEFGYAIDNFKTAYSLKSDYEDAILWLGISYEKSGDRKNAIKYYKKAIDIKPYDFFARYKLAGVLEDFKEVRKIVNFCFKLTPQDLEKTMPLQISYSADSFKKSVDGQDPLMKAIYENIVSIKNDERVYLSIDIIKLDNFSLDKMQGELAFKLSRKYKPLSYKLITRGYTLEGGSNLNQKADEIVKDIQSLLKGSSNYRLNFNIRREKIKNEMELGYIPRNVGNDMGLWVIGNPWINVVEDEVENGSGERDTRKILVNALGMLLIGKIEESEVEFRKIVNQEAELSNLALGVIYYLKGDKKTAIEYFKYAHKINPDNKVVEENLRYLSGN